LEAIVGGPETASEMVVNVSTVPKVAESKRFPEVELVDELPTGASLGPPLLKEVFDVYLTAK